LVIGAIPAPTLIEAAVISAVLSIKAYDEGAINALPLWQLLTIALPPSVSSLYGHGFIEGRSIASVYE